MIRREAHVGWGANPNIVMPINMATLGFAPQPTRLTCLHFLRAMIQRNLDTICAARNFSDCLVVIPAKAGIHASYWRWIPAFAGMTIRFFVAIYQRDSRGVRP
jgi:hypothetical protein